jgi:hypothetical protein
VQVNGAGSKDDLWYVRATIPNGCLEPVAIPCSRLDKGLLMDVHLGESITLGL